MFLFPSKSINFIKTHAELKKKIVKLGIVITTRNLCWAQLLYPFFMKLLVTLKKNKLSDYGRNKPGALLCSECCSLVTHVERRRL